MMVVYKYEVGPLGSNISINERHEILKIVNINGDIFVWVLNDLQSPPITAIVYIILTGEKFAGPPNSRYIGTLITHTGLFVQHFFINYL